MKELISLFILMCIVAAMTSCAANYKKHHAKKHGIVQHGCTGIKALKR